MDTTQVFLAIAYSAIMFLISQLASNRRIRAKTEAVKTNAQEQLNAQFATSEQQRAEMTETAMIAQAAAADATLKLTKALGRIDRLEEQRQFDANRIKILTEDQAMLREVNVTSHKQIDGLNTLLGELRKQLDAANAELEKARAERAAERTRAEREIAAERSRAETAEKAHQNDQSRIAELEEQVGKLKLEIEALKKPPVETPPEPQPETPAEMPANS